MLESRVCVAFRRTEVLLSDPTSPGHLDERRRFIHDAAAGEKIERERQLHRKQANLD